MQLLDVRKSVKITRELDELLKSAVKVTGSTEASFIKMAIFDKVKGFR